MVRGYASAPFWALCCTSTNKLLGVIMKWISNFYKNKIKGATDYNKIKIQAIIIIILAAINTFMIAYEIF